MQEQEKYVRKLSPREIEITKDRELSHDKIEAAVKANPGMSYTQISQMLGLSLTTIQRVVSDRKLNRGRGRKVDLPTGLATLNDLDNVE